MHHIQHYILSALSQQKWARFTDLRPPRVDSNVYSYHLRALQKDGYIEKRDKSYRLSPTGLFLVDNMSAKQLTLRQQPKILTSVILYDEHGKVLLLQRHKQPFIDAWTLPNGKVHIEDESVRAAMAREIDERVHIPANDSLTHIADVSIRALIDGQLVSTVLNHLFTMRITRADILRADVLWTDAKVRKKLQLVPAGEDMILLGESNAGFLFREYVIDW